jgi:glutaredoxin
MPGVNFLLALLAASALSQARAHLAAGKLDAVLIDLQEPHGAPADEARVLIQAAEQAKTRSGPSGAGNADDALALLLAQTAMRRNPADARPVRLLGEWSLAAREFGQSERYAGLWLKAAPESEEAKRFALKVKLLDESWHPALLEKPRKKKGGLVRREPRAAVAQEDLGAPYKSPHADKALVSVYGTAWCPACRAAREYLIRRHIPFSDYDVERDAEARRELAEKQARAGVHFGGVPVIDVNGKLMEGFSSSAIDDALLH